MKRIIVGLVAAFAFGGPAKVAAETIKLTFSGTITQAGEPTGGSYASQYPLGTAFSVTVSYNPNAAPIDPANPSDFACLSTSLTIGGTTLVNKATDPGYTSVYESFDGRDHFVHYGVLDENQYMSGSHYYVTLLEDTLTALTSSRLPTNLSLDQFQVAGVGLAIKGPDEEMQFTVVSGTITDVSVTSIQTAPEPSSLVLLASAGTGWLGMAWRRSRRRGTIR
jgi:hypothetical protein